MSSPRLLQAACAALLGGVGLALTALAQDPPAPTFANVTVHDPSVLRAGSTYYVYGSHMASASTTDLMSWTQLTTGPTFPNSLIRNQNPQTEFSEILAWAQTTTFWAPDVIRLGDGRYYMYYCACKGDSPRSALGLAVADSPTGPFAHVAVLLKSGMAGASEDGTTYNANVHPNVVDPAVFFDQAGKLWMVYGSYSGGIFIMEMDPATGLQKPGQGYGKKLIGGNHSRIEGAYIIYSPESAYYYLFLSFGGLDAAGGYNIRIGRSRNPDGPFLDAAGTDLTNVKGPNGSFFDDAAIAPHGVKLMGGYQFLHVAGEPGSTSRGYISPGHNSVYYDPATAKYSLVFHTRFVGRGETHEVRVHPMFVNADDWLVVAPHRYAGETIASTDLGRIVGNYKLINHGKAITATVSTSAAISLLAGGSVTGAVAGTWQLAGNHDVTLVLAGTTYRGVFVRQWDDDSQVWVLTFTALSNNGVAVWGSKVAINTAPAILLGPTGQTVSTGANITLTTVASGDPAPTYQWKKNNVDIGGATGSSYQITNANTGDAGSYTVVATNSVNSATSNAATLTVSVSTVAPAITIQPVSQAINAGSSVTFTAAASGNPAPTYQWRKNGVDIPGAVNPTYTIAGVIAADAGAYSFTATNLAGSVSSGSALLTVIVPPTNAIISITVE